MKSTLLSLVVGFCALALIFSILERVAPAIPGQRWWRRGIRTDLVYWLFTPLVSKPAGQVAAIAAVLIVAALLGAPLGGGRLGPWIEARRTFFSQLPPGLQALLALLIADFTAYWSHRLFHRGRLWRFHAVHHAPVELDWLSSVRVHPINEMISHALLAVPLFALGFRPGVLAGAIPFLTFYAIFVHANVPWTFGPLKYVIATPAFHRWHHTSQEEGLDKNFAGLFPIFDILFGTFYMPKGRTPARFGILGGNVPEGFFAQMLYPFKKERRQS